MQKSSYKGGLTLTIHSQAVRDRNGPSVVLFRLLSLLFMLQLIGGCAAEREAHGAPVPIKQPSISYRLDYGDGTKPWRIIFERSPSYIHALEMAPAQREVQLNKGSWLILAFFGLSAPDVRCIDVAIQAVVPYKGMIRLGVRPVSQYAEMASWFPEYGNNRGSPVWIAYKDGKLQGWSAGVMDETELKLFLVKLTQGNNTISGTKAEQ